MRAAGDRLGKFLEYAASQAKMYEDTDTFDMRMAEWESTDDLIALVNKQADAASDQEELLETEGQEESEE